MEREHHAYGGARSQYGELFVPGGDGPHPVAVVVHGGFWRAQHGRRQTRGLCADLAARGWAAWNVEYRRLGRLSGGGWPRTLEDAAAAVDHLADIPHVPLDLSRVVAIGFSAGGQLAAWLATRPAPRVPVTGVVSQAGVVDLRLASELRLSRGVVHRFLGGSPEAVPERYAAASPAERLPLGVPALLVHGTADTAVPPVMSERFAVAAQAAGDRVELALVPGEEHVGHLDPAGRLWAPVIAWLARHRAVEATDAQR
jgi:acetyl esterase/lipase